MQKLKRFFSYPATHYVLIFICVAVGLYLTISLITELGTPNYGFRGTHYDFLAFYSAASSAWHHNVARLYDSADFIRQQRQIIPHPVGASGYMPFLNPPFVAVLLAPLALMNGIEARIVWLVVSVLMAVFIIHTLTKPLNGRQKLLAMILLLTSFPMYQTFIEGQLSILVLLGGCLSYLFFTQRRKFLSGVSLVLLWVLPQFAIFALIALAIKHEWRMLKGWTLSSLSVGLLTLPFTGLGIYFTYVRVLASTTGNHFIDMSTSAPLTWRGALNLSMGLNGFYSALLGQKHVLAANILYGITAVALIVLLIKTVHALGPKPSLKQQALAYVASLSAALLIDPHLFAQDIIVIYLLLPALYTLFKRDRFKAVIALVAICDLTIIDQYIRLHFFTLAILLAVVYAIKQKSTIESR